MRPKIFVCQPIPPVAIDRMRQFAEVEIFPFSHRAISIAELESAARRSDYLFCMHETPITASIVAANPNLRGFGISHPYPGIVDADAAAAAGIPLLMKPRSPEEQRANRRHDTSDLMVALILNLAYRVLDADRYCRGSGYFQEMTMDLMGLGCFDRTVSLYGFGKVARGAVKTLRGLDMKLLYNKRTRLDESEEEELGIEWVADTDELIARGDYVCILANFEDVNYKLIGAREFALMKPSAFFINVARGRLVDEDALIDALEKGTIAGAGLDVFWHEPPVVVDPYIPEALRKMTNVVLTPHNGNATYETRGRATLEIADAIIDDIVRRASLEMPLR